MTDDELLQELYIKYYESIEKAKGFENAIMSLGGAIDKSVESFLSLIDQKIAGVTKETTDMDMMSPKNRIIGALKVIVEGTNDDIARHIYKHTSDRFDEIKSKMSYTTSKMTDSELIANKVGRTSMYRLKYKYDENGKKVIETGKI
jgi:hypothetical protein